MSSFLRTIIVSLILITSIASFANDCKRETYKVIYKKKHNKEMPKNERVPSTLQMKPTVATLFQELVSICEIKNIKSILESNRWRTLCPPAAQNTKLRCFRSYLSKHNFQSPTEMNLMAVTALGVALNERNRWKNTNIALLRLLEVVLYIFEKADPSDFLVSRLKKYHNVKSNAEMKKLDESYKKTYTKNRNKIIKIVDQKYKKIKWPSAKDLSDPQVAWILQRKPKIEKRIHNLKNGKRTW